MCIRDSIVAAQVKRLTGSALDRNCGFGHEGGLNLPRGQDGQSAGREFIDVTPRMGAAVIQSAEHRRFQQIDHKLPRSGDDRVGITNRLHRDIHPEGVGIDNTRPCDGQCQRLLCRSA